MSYSQELADRLNKLWDTFDPLDKLTLTNRLDQFIDYIIEETTVPIGQCRVEGDIASFELIQELPDKNYDNIYHFTYSQAFQTWGCLQGKQY